MANTEESLIVNTDTQFTSGYLLSSLNNIFNERLKSILNKIADDNSLNKDKLFNEYLVSSSSSIEPSTPIGKRKRKKNKVLGKDELCMARKADNAQCTRRRKDSMEYCGKHCNNLKFGRIDDDDKYSNNENFIVCSTEQLNGVNYLVDSNSIVYTLDFESPEVVGKKNKDGQLVLMSDIKEKLK